MTREHRILTFVRRLRPAPVRFAAAAAPYDPSLLLALQAASAVRDEPCAAR
jgi:hypothetical protein